MSTKFVQIGNVAFAPEPGMLVRFDESGEYELRVRIRTSAGEMVFHGPSAHAFEDWWARKVNVEFFNLDWYEEEENGKGTEI